MSVTTLNGNGLAAAVLDLAPIAVNRSDYYRDAQRLARIPAERTVDPVVVSSVKPGRQTGAAWPGIMSAFGWKTIPRRQYRDLDISRLDIARMAPHQLMETVAELSPDVSQALWNNLLLTNSGYEIAVLDVKGEPDKEGQRLLTEAILPKINARGGGLDGLIDQFHYTAYLQGAMAGELALAPGLRAIEDIYAVSPWTISFVRDDPRPRPVQQLPSDLRPRELNEATFLYFPILPAVDDPYGRMPFASVIGPIHFYLQLMRDLQVAVHANAWDKLDIKVIESAVVASMPEGLQSNPVERARWMGAVVDSVKEAFDGLRPDDHFIHTDATEIDAVAGGNRSVGVVPVFRLLERSIFRALKQLPIMMGSNEGTTETHGTIQFEVYVDGIQAVQHRTKHMLEHFLTVALQVLGRQATVVLTWEQIRTTDREKDAKSQKQEIANAAAKRDEGWVTQDQASIEVTGEPAVLPEPVRAPPPAEPDGDESETTDGDDDDS